MREKVAVATVNGHAYFLVVNELKEQKIPFVSLLPGQSVPSEVKVVITTVPEAAKISHEKLLLFAGENELEDLVNEVKRILQGKDAYERIIIGIDPGGAIGLAVIADGKVIGGGNCFTAHELVGSIQKTIKQVNFAVTSVQVKIGNGVPLYKTLLKDLDDALPSQVKLEVVGEAGTNRPLKENRRSRGVRHISSAIRIAGRAGNIVSRSKQVAANS